MKHLYKYALILSIHLLPFGMNSLSAQSYDLEKIDIELCKIYNEDQQIRIKFIELMQNPSVELILAQKEMDSIDAKNQIYVANLLDNYGWSDNLSDSANKTIFLVIDHGDKSYSEKYFKLVKEKADQGIIPKSDAATLEDRILMRTNKPQKYGTQTRITTYYGKENVLCVWPIEYPEKIDELRLSVGLSPISTYMQLVEEMSQMEVIWDKELTVRYFKNKRRQKKQRNKS